MAKQIFRKQKSWIAALLLAFVSAQGVKAEHTFIEASIDSTILMIGQQSLLHLNITADQGKVLQLPVLTDTITAGVEVLNSGKIDTFLLDNNRMQLRQSFMVTSFDSALYYIPPFKVIDGIDTVFSNSLALKVATYPIDTPEDIEIFDIKETWKPPFVFSDYIWWFITPLLLALVGLAAWFIARYLRKHRKERVEITPEMLIPAHELAIKALDEIKQEKIWHQGRVKEYYTRLTDVLRVYLENRYSIDAMEMTSSEIIESIRDIKEARPVYDRFKELLMTADFVKFAKYTPAPDENESLLFTAYSFVDTTKKIEVKEEENTDNSLNDSEVIDKEQSENK